MFVATAFGRVVALDATTGKEKWTFHLPDNEPIVAGGSVRGLHYWPGDKDNKPRLVIVSIRLKLFTLDPQTGKSTAPSAKTAFWICEPGRDGQFSGWFLGATPCR